MVFVNAVVCVVRRCIQVASMDLNPATLTPSAVSVVMGSGAETQIQSFIKEQKFPKFDVNPQSNSNSSSNSDSEEKSWCLDVWEGDHHPGQYT